MTPDLCEKHALWVKVNFAEEGRSARWIEVVNVTTAISNLCMAIKDGFYLPSDDKKVHWLMVALSRRLSAVLEQEKFIRSARAELGDFDPMAPDEGEKDE